MDANWTMLTVLAVITGFTVWTGKVWFRRWFNPLSMYSGIWGFCLCNYELHLIQYYEISTLAWIYIFAAWTSLYLGAGIVLLLTGRQKTKPPCDCRDLTKLRNAILLLSSIGLIGLVGQLFAIHREFGNPLTVLATSPWEIYAARLSNDLDSISYIGSVTFAACPLAGVYAARIGRLTWVVTIPLILIILQLILVMGRTGLGLAAVLFLAAFAYTPKAVRFSIQTWQRVFGAALAFTLVATFFMVSAVRRLDVNFPGITPQMERASEYIPFLPSIYSNFSATPVAFSVYLQNSEHENRSFWGMYTFGPIFRILARLGFRCEVPAHEENYYTPVPMNTSTYLKNIYSDFGLSGLVFFPLLLGAGATFLSFRVSSTTQTLGVTILAHLFVIIVFAFAFDFMVLGDWYIGFGAGTLAASIVDVT